MAPSKTQHLCCGLLIALGITILSACNPIDSASSEKKEGPNTFTASTYSLNYSSKYFFDYTVYDTTDSKMPAIGGAAVDPLGGGDQGCCIALPKMWRPGLKVLIKWSYADREKIHEAYSREFEIPRYAEPGNLFVTFYDANDVELVVSRYEAGHPQWPGRIKTDPMSHCLATEANKKQCEQWSARNMTRPSPQVLLKHCNFQNPSEACQFLISSCVEEFGEEACSEKSVSGGDDK